MKVRTCVACEDFPSSHFSPHTGQPLCWWCAGVEEEEHISKLLEYEHQKKQVYLLMEDIRGACVMYPKDYETLGKAIHAIRCQITKSNDQVLEPLGSLQRIRQDLIDAAP